MKNEKLKNIRESIDYGEIKYKILNPGGNKTALVKGNEYTDYQKRLINKMIMERNPQVEQVGFLSNKIKRLEMAGGEFCMNATRCAIYEYSKENREEVEISVSGTNKILVGRILNDNKVEVRLDIGKNMDDLIEIKNDFICVKIDGILIAILDEEKSKKYIQKLKENEEVAKNELKQLMITEIDSEEKAIGIMLLEKESEKTKINPIVWVKEIDTVFYETACGSGSLGVAIYKYLKNKDKKIELIQPSGYSINIEIDENKNYIEKAIVSGIVEEE